MIALPGGSACWRRRKIPHGTVIATHFPAFDRRSGGAARDGIGAINLHCVLNAALPRCLQSLPASFSFNSSRCLNYHSNVPLMISALTGERAGEYVASGRATGA
jgi:hypothetical protein